MSVELPTELTIKILENLYYIYLVRCRKLCRKMKAIVDETPSLRYKLERAAAGYFTDDAASCSAEALKHFRKAQQGYKHPSPTPSWRLNFHSLGDKLQKYLADLYYWIILGDYFIMTFSSNKQQMAVVSLRQATPNNRRLRVLDLGVPYEEFFIDETQDLVLIVSPDQLHYRSFTTGEVHGKVKPRTGELTSLFAQYHEAAGGRIVIPFDLSIHGDWLLFRVQSTEDPSDEIICLYNWPEDRVSQKWPSKTSKSQTGLIYSTGCLAHGHIFLSAVSTYGGPLRIDVLSLPSMNSPPTDTPYHAATYLLPLWHPPGNPRRDSPYGSFRILNGDGLATPSRIAMPPSLLRVYLPLPGDNHEVLYVPISTFVTDAVMSHTRGQPPKVVSWEDWGPEKTRLFSVVSEGGGTADSHPLVAGPHILYANKLVTLASRMDNFPVSSEPKGADPDCVDSEGDLADTPLCGMRKETTCAYLSTVPGANLEAQRTFVLSTHRPYWEAPLDRVAITARNEVQHPVYGIDGLRIAGIRFEGEEELVSVGHGIQDGGFSHWWKTPRYIQFYEL